MIDFTELKVYKRELLTDSPYTDCFMMLGQNEYKEKLDTMENKLHRMYLDSNREFRPGFTHLVLSLDRRGHVSNDKIILRVGSAGYYVVPMEKLRLESNEELNEKLLNILKGHVLEFNAMEKKFTTPQYQRLYDIDNIEPIIYRNREGELCTTWVTKDKSEEESKWLVQLLF